MHLGICWRSYRIAPSYYLGRLRTVKLTADGECASVECGLARDLPRVSRCATRVLVPSPSALPRPPRSLWMTRSCPRTLSAAV